MAPEKLQKDNMNLPLFAINERRCLLESAYLESFIRLMSTNKHLFYGLHSFLTCCATTDVSNLLLIEPL